MDVSQPWRANSAALLNQNEARIIVYKLVFYLNWKLFWKTKWLPPTTPVKFINIDVFCRPCEASTTLYLASAIQGELTSQAGWLVSKFLKHMFPGKLKVEEIKPPKNKVWYQFTRASVRHPIQRAMGLCHSATDRVKMTHIVCFSCDKMYNNSSFILYTLVFSMPWLGHQVLLFTWVSF